MPANHRNNQSDRVRTRLRRLSKPTRIALGTGAWVLYAAGAIFAIFPRSYVGLIIYDVILSVCGLAVLSVLICCSLHFAEQVIRSIAHWKKVRHEPDEPFLLGDDSVKLFSGWVQNSFLILFFFIILGFWVAILGFAAYLISFGNLGFVPDLGRMP